MALLELATSGLPVTLVCKGGGVPIGGVIGSKGMDVSEVPLLPRCCPPERQFQLTAVAPALPVQVIRVPWAMSGSPS